MSMCFDQIHISLPSDSSYSLPLGFPPNFICAVLGPLSPLNALCMCLAVGSSIRMWTAYGGRGEGGSHLKTTDSLDRVSPRSHQCLTAPHSVLVCSESLSHSRWGIGYLDLVQVLCA